MSRQQLPGVSFISGPDKIDEHVGLRLRQGREASRLSKEELAAALGLSLLELDDIETGRARLTPTQMFAASKALSVKPFFFFEALE